MELSFCFYIYAVFHPEDTSQLLTTFLYISIHITFSILHILKNDSVKQLVCIYFHIVMDQTENICIILLVTVKFPSKTIVPICTLINNVLYTSSSPLKVWGIFFLFFFFVASNEFEIFKRMKYF